MRNLLFFILLALLLVSSILFADELEPIPPGTDSVRYEADELFYDVIFKKAKLYGNVDILFDEFLLSSDTVELDIPASILKSFGKSLVKGSSDQFIGRDLWFDTQDKYGLFKRSSGKFDVGYFYGSEVRKSGDSEYDVDHGLFTTCENDDSHFDFYAVKMRIYRSDKIIMKPVVFIVNHVPIFAMPTMSFSIRRGERSGMLTPRPGYNNVDGKFLENIAYYGIFDDFADALFVLNIRERTGLDGNILVNYVKRYKYKGSLSTTHKRTVSDAGRAREINSEYHYKHNQTFENKSKLSVDVNYVTSSQMNEDKQDIDERLNQTIKSNVGYTRPFLSSVLNLSGNFSEDLLTQKKTITLPNASFSLPTRPFYELFLPYKPPQDENNWWEDFSYSFSFGARHSGTINEKKTDISDILFKSKKNEDGSFKNTHNLGAFQKISLTHGRKFFDWLNFNQSFPINMAYSSGEMNYEPFAYGYDYNYSSSLSFNVYGFKNFRTIFLKGVRHTIAISSNYTLKRDFSKINKDYNGIYGVDKGGRNEALSVNIGNTWDFKIDPFGKTEETRLNGVASATTSYKVFENEKNNIWSDILYNGRVDGTQILPIKLTFGVFSATTSNPNTITATQDPYNFEIKKWNYDIRLNNAVTMTLRANSKYFIYQPYPENRFQTNKFFNTSAGARRADYVDKSNMLTSTLSYNYFYKYDYTKEDGGTSVDDYSQNLNNSVAFFLSRTWALNYSNSYNIKTDDLVSQNLAIVKDLHCWQMKFSFTKTGSFWRYAVDFFNVALPNDLKMDRKGDSND